MSIKFIFFNIRGLEGLNEHICEFSMKMIKYSNNFPIGTFFSLYIFYEQGYRL